MHNVISLENDETYLFKNILLSLSLDLKDIEVSSNDSQSHILSVSCNVLYIGLYILSTVK